MSGNLLEMCTTEECALNTKAAHVSVLQARTHSLTPAYTNMHDRQEAIFSEHVDTRTACSFEGCRLALTSPLCARTQDRAEVDLYRHQHTGTHVHAPTNMHCLHARAFTHMQHAHARTHTRCAHAQRSRRHAQNHTRRTSARANVG
eukprot:6208173-Pleurochrysis_carterae.AAC.3